MLANPERDWFAPAKVERHEIERRIGSVSQYEVLSGGLVNRNVRFGDRVLRIYRDSRALGKERTLLAQDWQTFRVPRVLDAGDDFLLLEYVEHRSLDESDGALVGRALAEIHARAYSSCGALDSAVRIERELDFSIGGYARAQATLDTRTEAFVNAFDIQHDAVLCHGDFKVSNLHVTPAGELLVLDWEYAWAGPALFDIGQLLRWHPHETFVRTFVDAYETTGAPLPDDWRRIAQAIDLGNLLGLAQRGFGAKATASVRERIEQTLRSDNAE